MNEEYFLSLFQTKNILKDRKCNFPEEEKTINPSSIFMKWKMQCSGIFYPSSQSIKTIFLDNHPIVLCVQGEDSSPELASEWTCTVTNMARTNQVRDNICRDSCSCRELFVSSPH